MIDFGPAYSALFSTLLKLAPFLIIAVLLKLFLPKLKGRVGEWWANRSLRTLPQEKYKILNDIMIRNGKGTTQIDHVVLSEYGIFVIETKNYDGLIYGSEKDRMWTQVMNRNSKFRFMNPLRQNYGHVKALQELTGEKHIESIVAFAGGRIMTEVPSNVIMLKDLKRYVEGFTEPVIPQEHVAIIRRQIEEANITNKEDRREHVRTVKRKKAGSAGRRSG